MEQQQGIFKDFKSATPVVMGSTTINHATRVRLGITADEYCFMQYLDGRKQKGEPLDLGHCWHAIGYREQACKAMYDALVAHGMLYPFTPGEVPQITDKWTKAFNTKAEFEKFWFMDSPQGRKLAWPGSRARTEQLFNKLRKEYTMEYLIKQRDYYFHFLILTKKYRNFDRAKMGGPVFLGPDKHFETDWKTQVKELEELYNPSKSMTGEDMSSKSVKDAFSK